MKKEEYKFEVEPTIVQELGRDLYSADNSIIVELIANSYDADAKNVWINFDKENNFISIKDDGIGMTEEVIKNYFLKVGQKNKTSEKTALGRIPLGRKGIGKLSFFALGNLISIKTVNSNLEFSFNLSFANLIENKNSIEILSQTLSEKCHSYTEIIIQEPLKNIMSDGFVKNAVIGISRVFSELLSEDFKIHFSADGFVIKEEILSGYHDICAETPTFGTALVFFSLDKKTDALLKKAKSNAESHSIKMKEASGLAIEDITMYMDSEETKKILDSNAHFKKVAKEENGVKFTLEGYIASNITSKNLNDSIQEESVFKNDSVSVMDGRLVVQYSNRRISLSANGRSGDLNIKGKVNLSDKFYTKYLFGALSMSALDNNDLPPIALPNREGYKTNSPRWDYISTISKILGDKAMNFANGIAGKKREKSEKLAEMSIAKSWEKYNKKLEELNVDSEAQEVVKDLGAEMSGFRSYDKDSEERPFILISYTSHPKENATSKETSYRLAKLLKSLKDDSIITNLRVLYTNATNELGFGKKNGERLYEVIKENLWRNPKRYRKFHIFCFVNEEYVHHWQTDIEYGMGYVNSDLSEHHLPIDMTTFMLESGATRNTLIGGNPPLDQDDMVIFSDEWLISKLPAILEKLNCKVSSKQIEDALSKMA